MPFIDVGTTKRKKMTEGSRFGRLTAVAPSDQRFKNGSQTVSGWRFRCECGGERIAPTVEVQRGRISSCGCDNPRRKQDLAGKRFGMWAVIKEGDKAACGRIRWQCECDCGEVREVQAAHLRSGKSTNCGCRKREIVANTSRTHGGSSSSEYRIWGLMKSRCTNSRLPEYKNYGGRGIMVCDEWASSYEAFIADMGPRPSLAHSIDRIDTNGNYEPGNCRWATAQVQANNTRRNHIVCVRGEEMTLAQAVRKFGGVYGTVKWRINDLGMSAEEALGL
jgi:hypothetical protein